MKEKRSLTLLAGRVSLCAELCAGILQMGFEHL